MKIIKTAILLLMTAEAVQLTYKSDDFDELLEGVITNNHKSDKKEEKPKGAVDTMVEEELAAAKAQEPAHEKKLFKPLSQQEQWKKLMEEPDPLQDQDIYAGERKKECTEEKSPANPEDLELEDDLTDVLTQSFNKEKKKSTFVNNIPEILTQKKDENFNKMFSGVTEQDIERMDI